MVAARGFPTTVRNLRSIVLPFIPEIRRKVEILPRSPEIRRKVVGAAALAALVPVVEVRTGVVGILEEVLDYRTYC